MVYLVGLLQDADRRCQRTDRLELLRGNRFIKRADELPSLRMGSALSVQALAEERRFSPPPASRPAGA